MTARLHRGDLPDLSRYGREVAIDTETMGLDPRRDRLCVVQLSPGDGSADVVQIPADVTTAPNHLHDLKRHLDRMLRREGRAALAETCFNFLPARIELDLLGWDEADIFAHS